MVVARRHGMDSGRVMCRHGFVGVVMLLWIWDGELLCERYLRWVGSVRVDVGAQSFRARC